MIQKPTIKQFDTSGYSELIDKLDKNMSEIEFEKLSEVVVLDILEKYENFNGVIKGPGYRGTPFDFFGFKEGNPYLIEYKGSLSSFNTPGETQKRRLQEILSQIEGLHIVLLQVKLLEGKYRIFCDEEMELLFTSKSAPIDSIIKWIRSKL